MARGRQSLAQGRGGEALRLLRDRLGHTVRTDAASLRLASFDSIKVAFPCEALVVPRKAAEVGEVLALAHRFGIPVTPRGAGSSRTGAAAPVQGGWVLDLSRLRRRRLDASAGMLTAEAGVVVADIQKQAEDAGWFYPPDPSSSAYCTLGGTIACNAGGLRGAKYGVTRDYVVSLRGYYAHGGAFEFGRPLRKWAVGYNLRDLMIGSEGTLGVVTEATLKLIPKPACRATLLAAFRTDTEALAAAQRLLAQGLLPAALEFLDAVATGGAEQSLGVRFFKEAPAAPLLLVELDGGRSEVEQGLGAVRQWAKAHAAAWREARSETEAAELWRARRACSSAMFAYGDMKLNEDIIVPASAHGKLMRFIRSLSRRSGLVIPVFGHAGDGNFHVNIMYHTASDRESLAARKAVESLMTAVVKWGGAISGEHGIGLAKSPFLSLQLAESERSLMQAIKQVMDPKGILNPGKIFQPFEIWNLSRVADRMPWDAK